jgi:hypothetical protein
VQLHTMLPKARSLVSPLHFWDFEKTQMVAVAFLQLCHKHVLKFKTFWLHLWLLVFPAWQGFCFTFKPLRAVCASNAKFKACFFFMICDFKQMASQIHQRLLRQSLDNMQAYWKKGPELTS